MCLKAYLKVSSEVNRTLVDNTLDLNVINEANIALGLAVRVNDLVFLGPVLDSLWLLGWKGQGKYG